VFLLVFVRFIHIAVSTTSAPITTTPSQTASKSALLCIAVTVRNRCEHKAYSLLGAAY